MSSYRDLLRQKYEQGHQMSGSALMGGVMGGYEGAAILPAFGADAREKQKAQYKLKHPERKYNGPVKGSVEAKEAGKRLQAARERNYAELAVWYDQQTTANGGKNPTAQQIRIARAELALARAKRKPTYKSKAGATQAALSKMSAQQRSAYDAAAAARNAALRDMNRIIRATEEMKMQGSAPPIHYEAPSESSPLIKPRSLKARLKAESKVEKREESPTVIYTKKSTGKKKKP